MGRLTQLLPRRRVAASGLIALMFVANAVSPAGAAPNPWDKYILAPASRTVEPSGVFEVGGTVNNAGGALTGGTTTISGAGSYVSFDFGKEVGGFVTLDFEAGTTAGQSVGLTFSESSLYVDPTTSDASNGGSNVEPPLVYAVTPGGTIDMATDPALSGRPNPTSLTSAATAGSATLSVASTSGLYAGTQILVDQGAAQETVTISAISGTALTVAPALGLNHDAGAVVAQGPLGSMRGGFRYLTVVNQTSGSLALAHVSVDITFAPNMSDLRDYPNYFYSNDDLVNRIWYAGAYTVQTNIIANDQGRVWRAPSMGWNNNALVGELGSTVLVDGPKRDRTVWPGDLGISVPTDFVSLGDMVTIKNSLQTLFNHQRADGALPFAGPAVNFIGFSDTYHMWTLIGTGTYYQYTGDRSWLDSIWGKYTKALSWIRAKIGSDDLLNVTGGADWARSESNGKQIEAQSIMYRTLQDCALLAGAEGDQTLAASCTTQAAALKAAVAAAGYWDPAVGLYRNYPAGTATTLYPQDGNGIALWSGLVDTADKAATISATLETRWTPVGALTPEKGTTSVHPFAGGMEVAGHLAAGQTTRGLDLIRQEWGYMLDAPHGTASTFWEGYRTDGSSDYNGSYLSMAHGWSTAPTFALTYYVLGIRPADGSLGYVISPNPGDLHHVEGQLTTVGGVIKLVYDADQGAGALTAVYTAPAGAVGAVSVPTFGNEVKVKLDGATVWNIDHATGKNSTARLVGDRIVLDGQGGTHTIVVTAKPGESLGN